MLDFTPPEKEAISKVVYPMLQILCARYEKETGRKTTPVLMMISCIETVFDRVMEENDEKEEQKEDDEGGC